jgi:hypothetical protein
MKKGIFISLLSIVALAAGCTKGPSTISLSFPAVGVERVVLRAANAKTAKVANSAGDAALITISGKATGGAGGYHAPAPGWKETPASEWGLGFVGQQFGKVLVISSKNEIEYIHHYYAIDEISLQLPDGVQLTLEPRMLDGSGEPNLRWP